MTPEAMATLHAGCFTVPRPWSAAEISALLESPFVFAIYEGAGFLLGRSVAGEAELLTLAVDATSRRQGIGRRLLAGFLDEAAARGCEMAHLEVAADNQAAIALYCAANFGESGRRRGYYQHTDGRRVDALVMNRKI